MQPDVILPCRLFRPLAQNCGNDRAMTNRDTPLAPRTIQKLESVVPPALAMLAGMQLEVFTALSDGPQTAQAIASRLGLAEQRLRRLLNALVLTGLMERRGEHFANSAEASEFLVKGRTRYIGGVHELLAELWHADFNTAASIRTGIPQALHDFAAMPDTQSIAFLRGLMPGALAVGRELAQRFDFSKCRSVIDVGGGPGSVLVGLCETYPNLRGTLFDLPQVVHLASSLIQDSDYVGRIAIEPGDILAAAPRSRHDAVVIKAVVQVLSPAEAALAIRHACAALVPGGTIYIVGGGILDNNELSPPGAVFLNLTLLNLYRGGGAYTEAQYFTWLAASGCVAPKRITLDNQSGIIWATKTS
jgi:hypothetical protein